MKTKPIIFDVTALVFMLLALSFPVQVMFLLGLEASDFMLSFNYLSDINLINMLTFATLSLGFYFAYQHASIFLVLSTVVVSLNNYWVSELGHMKNSLLPIGTTLIYGVIIFSFYKSKYFELLSNRKLHWWKTPTRFKCDLDFAMNSNHEGKVLNASKSGLLVKFSRNVKKSLNSVVDFELMDSSGVLFSLKAQVVRVCPHTGGHGLQLLSSSKSLDQYLTKNCQQIT